jgi:predicted nucleic acid-binding protein
MINFFIDTSALIKIYHKEVGTEEMLTIYKGSDTLAISELAKIELLSSIYRKYRENEITQITLDLIVEKFENDCEERYDVLYFSSLIFEESWHLIRQLSKKYGLKTLDSLQFSFFKTYCDKKTVFACADLTLEKLIKREGFNTYLPL